MKDGQADLEKESTEAVAQRGRAVFPHEWRQSADLWAAMRELLADRFADRGISLRPSWDEFPRIHALVRTYLFEYGHLGFRRTWPRIAEPLDLDAVGDQARWEARCLGELAWLCVRGVGDSGFAVWDTGKLVRHLNRLWRLDLPVPDHHAPGEPSVRAAILWSGADLSRWERLLAATGRLSAPAALAAAVASLVEARSENWAAVTRDPDRLGAFSLTGPAGNEVTIDLTGSWEGRTACQVGVNSAGPGRSGPKGWVYDYADPHFLVALADRLRDLGLVPRPPVWPIARPWKRPDLVAGSVPPTSDVTVQ